MVCAECLNEASNCSQLLEEECRAGATRFSTVLSIYLGCVFVFFCVVFLLEKRWCPGYREEADPERDPESVPIAESSV